MSEKKIEVVKTTITSLDVQEFTIAMFDADALARKQKYYDKIDKSRRSEQLIDDKIGDMCSAVNEIVKTLKIQKNTLVGKYKGTYNYNSESEIYINALGIRTKNGSYGQQTNNMSVKDFRKTFNKTLLLKIDKELKAFQKERFKPMMEIADELGSLGYDVEKLEYTFPVVKLYVFDGSNFSTHNVSKISFPSVGANDTRRYRDKLDKYQLLQLRTFLEPLVDEYNARLDDTLNIIGDMTKKIKGQYALLFMFRQGKKGR